ncbi:MAG: ABC transporter substrate-binding protein [Trueperaceae bacterium]|nr:ABC transporter substrate-binding protein [Trueperaceae bacterium]
MKKFLLSAIVLMLGFALAQDPVRVGSKQFTENIVLGKLIVQALEDAGIAVEDRTNLGSTQVNRSALENGEIDVYPEYTGTAISNYFRTVDYANIPEGASQDAYASYAVVSSLDASINDLVWLRPAPANNTYAFAVTRAFADENQIFSVPELAEFINAGNFVKVATGDEFAQRPDGIPSFESTYGFQFSDDQLLIIAGGTPAQTEKALNEGANDVNIAMAYGTDGALVAYDFVVLEDPSGAQPVFQPAPVFRGEVIRNNPEIAGILNPIFSLLDAETLQNLNARVEVDGENPDDVAASFLQENGFTN